MQKMQWLDGIGTWMPDAQFCAAASFDEAEMVKAENERLQAENEELKRQLVVLRVDNSRLVKDAAKTMQLQTELSAINGLLDRVQSLIYSLDNKSSAKMVKDVFASVRDELDMGVNPLNLPTREAA